MARRYSNLDGSFEDENRWASLLEVSDNESYLPKDLKKAPPWEKFVTYPGPDLVNPFTGVVEETGIKAITNPDYDPDLLDRTIEARDRIRDRAVAKILTSGVFREGSYEPREISKVVKVPNFKGGWVEDLVVVENPGIQEMRDWVYKAQRKNRFILSAQRESMPKGQLVQEIELVEPTTEGFSYLKKFKVKSKEFTNMTKNAENQLGKLIVKRRKEAQRANKIVFEFPDTQVVHQYPGTYYRPKFMKLFNSFSKGTYMPQLIAEDYTLDTKGRWPKRDGHRVALVGSPKEHSKWGETLIVQDLDVGDNLRVNIKYILPPEEKILKWE
jgi:hypothetical protein